MFRGINAVTIDTKGRLAIPTRYRQALGSALVVTIDTKETCLLMYPTPEWQIIENNLRQLSNFNAATRRVQRLLIGHATDIDLDNNGRLLLPTMLRNLAQLNKDVVMIGQGNKFELWDAIQWQSRRDQWLQDEAFDPDGLSDEMKSFSL